MQIVAAWAGHYYDPASNHDKVWAAAYTDNGDYLAVWGRRGRKKYESQVKHFGSLYAASRQYDKMVSEKSGKGYRAVPFEDARYGNIPAFGITVGEATRSPKGASAAKITAQSILDRMKALMARIAKKFEPDTQLVEFKQLEALTSLFVDYAATPAGSAPANAATLQGTEQLAPVLEQLKLQVAAALLD